jgi:hypothetical protein
LEQAKVFPVLGFVARNVAAVGDTTQDYFFKFDFGR